MDKLPMRNESASRTGDTCKVEWKTSKTRTIQFGPCQIDRFWSVCFKNWTSKIKHVWTAKTFDKFINNVIFANSWYSGICLCVRRLRYLNQFFILSHVKRHFIICT